eukprot:m.106840 g.106840  ORF g.106840 m.106840 type:complete len:72 (+) comp22552_c0_seq5:1150-1365(+)
MMAPRRCLLPVNSITWYKRCTHSSMQLITLVLPCVSLLSFCFSQQSLFFECFSLFSSCHLFFSRLLPLSPW